MFNEGGDEQQQDKFEFRDSTKTINNLKVRGSLTKDMHVKNHEYVRQLSTKFKDYDLC